MKMESILQLQVIQLELILEDPPLGKNGNICQLLERTYIAYAVHQAASFLHNPQNSHSLEIKRILRYIKKPQDKGMYMHPDWSLKLPCYVFAAVGRLFGSEDPGICSYPIWLSKLQTQLTLSNMEAEYISLSLLILDPIPL